MIAFLLSCIFSVTSFFFKRSKLFLIFFFVFMWVLFGWNYSNADLPMYKRLYSTPINDLVFIKFEGGYSFLMYCSKYVGLTFQQFLIVTSGVVLLFILRFFYIFSYLPAILSVCFFWCFFPLEFVILRNFIAFSIVLQGLICVLREEKYYHLKFVFCVLVASTIHVSSLLYLLFLLAFNREELKIKHIVLSVIILLLVTVLSHDLIYELLSLYSIGKVNFYSTSLKLFLFYSAIQVINLFTIKYFFGLKENPGSETTIWRNTVLVNINIIMLLLIVVYFELAVFVRILFNMSIVNLVFITNKSFLIENSIKPKIIFLLYLLFWFFCFIYFVKEGTIYSLLNNNLILS